MGSQWKASHRITRPTRVIRQFFSTGEPIFMNKFSWIFLLIALVFLSCKDAEQKQGATPISKPVTQNVPGSTSPLNSTNMKPVKSLIPQSSAAKKGEKNDWTVKSNHKVLLDSATEAKFDRDVAKVRHDVDCLTRNPPPDCPPR